jgi:sialic acid synthase SpsE
MKKTYVIAEAACAHQGKLDLAMRMVDVAVAARCDCFKTQIFRPELIPNISREERKYLDNCVFDNVQFRKLRDYCEGRIDFLLTPFDIPSVARILELQLNTIKVPSGRLFDMPFMAAVKSTSRKLIISTGMCDYKEIQITKRKFAKSTKWLHCTSSYPTKYKDLNLSVLKGKMFDGLSDHTLCTWVPAIAVGIGAKIIEKHFTLRRTLPGPDMKVSLEPLELMEMVRNIRDVEKMLGDGKKKIEEAEKAMIYRKVK